VLTIAFAAQTQVEERVLEPSFEIVHHYAWRGQLYPQILALINERANIPLPPIGEGRISIRGSIHSCWR